MSSLDTAFAAYSPRLNPRPVPLISRLISASVVIFLLLLFAQAFIRQGLGAWATGVVYVLYDTALLIFTFWQVRILARPLPEPSATSRPSLGVIVAAHNEAQVLAVTIDTLLASNDPPDAILLADDGSTDDSRRVMMQRYGLLPPEIGMLSPPSPDVPILRWLRLPHGGKARALNAALTQIDTDIVLTVDADTLLEPQSLGAMRRAFAAEPALVAATGVLNPICDHSRSGRFFQWFQAYEYVRNFLSRFAWERLNGLLLISGACAGFRRQAVLDVGGFDPECLVEDYELIHRLHRYSADRSLGWHVRVIGEVRASTDAPGTLGAFLRQRRRWFGGFLQTQHWNRDMVGNGRFGLLGTAMLPVKALDTLQPIYGLTAFALLLFFLATGRTHIAGPILMVIFAKILIDLSFHLWSLRIYRRWTGAREKASTPLAVLASLIEPFSFQLIRHSAAAWGWWTFLTGRSSWGRQTRGGIHARQQVPAE
ncbi:glycosyltransferase family 2 protein [Flavisphingomonas formosensis]|uniref:glycosyltransferase family 2 protein n=1 Tax=Flavisphingomonas formosensis TaxID=861534 RepID=UPI0012FCEAB5|nr:glycosyltransferase [Sphingomonas formosensis]